MAFTPAKPWNFPMYRSPGNYNATGGDVYYTPSNSITDFIDTGSVTAIMAVYLPIGFAASSYVYDSTYPVGGATYPPFFTMCRRLGGIDNNIFMRAVWNPTTEEAYLQFYTYDGTTYRGRGIYASDLGHPVEGHLLQCAFSADSAGGINHFIVNGNYLTNSVTPWATLNLHATNDARLVLNHSANKGNDTFTVNCNAEVFYGPLLIDDEPLDLTPEGADYNRVFDENGDFLWAGEDGALWLHDTGVTKPWYFSESYFPLTQKGTMSASFAQYNGVYEGYVCGSKEDFTMRAPHMDLAEATSGIEFLLDFTRPFSEENMWITSGYGANNTLLRRLSSSYTCEQTPPLRSKSAGSAGFDKYVAGTYGWYTYTTTNPLCSVAALATELSLTMTMDFSEGANETFGYRKIAGWGTSSGSANFRVTGPWPSESNRYITNTVYPAISAQFGLGWTVPNDTGLTAWTWQWNNGVMKLWVNGVVRSTVDRSGTDTQLRNLINNFGLRDSTSSSSGSLIFSTDFLMVNSVALTDQQIIDLHASLIDRG